MEKIINNSNLSNEQIEQFLKSLDYKFGFFDMHHNGGATACFAVDKTIAVIMHDSNWSDARNAGGIERKSSLRIYNNEFAKLGELDLGPYRHRSNERYDDYSRHLVEITNIEIHDERVRVSCLNSQKNIVVHNIALKKLPDES